LIATVEPRQPWPTFSILPWFSLQASPVGEIQTIFLAYGHVRALWITIFSHLLCRYFVGGNWLGTRRWQISIRTSLSIALWLRASTQHYSRVTADDPGVSFLDSWDKVFANGKQTAYSLATVAPSFTAWMLKLVRGKCTRTSLPSASDLTLSTTSSRVSPTSRPWSRCLTPVSIGQTSTSIPFFRPIGSFSSTPLSFSANLASTMRLRAASPFSVFGLATAALAALIALLNRSCHAKTLGYCLSEIRSRGSAPLSPMSQSMVQIAVRLH
jgi:hypothetical protein